MEPRPAVAGDASPLPLPSRGRSASEHLAAVPPGLWLTGLVAVSAIARFVVSLRSPVPWIFPDEWIYAELAKSVSQSGRFDVWGTVWPVRTSGPLYPILVSPAYALTSSGEDALIVIKALNALFMSLAAIPAYLLARRILSRQTAFLLAVLTLLVPAMVYTTKVMTENVAYPVFLFAALGIVRVLEHPTAARQALALALLGLAFLTRGEMLVLVPAYLSAIVLLAILDARSTDGGSDVRSTWSRLRAYRATWIIVSAGAAVALAAPLVLSRSPTVLLGSHAQLLNKVRLPSTPQWLVYQLGELDLASGIVPFAAYLLVVTLVVRNRRAPRSHRVFVALSTSLVAWFVLLGAAYATQPRPLPHVFERYVFYVQPCLFLGFLLWLAEGLPRPRRWALAATGVACALPAALPFATLLNGHEWGVSSSTPALVPWALLHPILGDPLLVLGILAVAAGLGAMFLRIGSDRRGFLALALVCNLWAVTLVVAHEDASVSRSAAARLAAEPGWVDATVGADAEVAGIYPGSDPEAPDDAYGLLEAQFFNRSVRIMYDLGPPMKEGIPSRPLTVRGSELLIGRTPPLRPLAHRYVLIADRVPLTGDLLARDRRSQLVLYDVDGSVRLDAPLR